MAEISEDELLPGEVSESDLMPSGGAEGGPAGNEPLNPGSRKAAMKMGTARDALNSLADTAALGAGPQIEGAMAAVAQAAIDPRPGKDVEAYRAVRDMGEKQHADSDNTVAGHLGGAVGTVLTPTPGGRAPAGMTAKQAAIRGAKTGAGVGLVSSAVNAPVDLTQKLSPEKLREYLTLLVGGTVLGAGGGALAGMGVNAVEKPLRSTARKLPMDMLGVSEPARRSMQKQGIYDEAGDELLKLVKPFRSGMRKGSLVEDLGAELDLRGPKVGAAIKALDDAAPGGATTTGAMRDAVKGRAQPATVGSLEDKAMAKRMGDEADNMMANHGELLPEVETPISLREAEAYKQRFGPAVGKELKMAAEPAAKTRANAETYRALRRSNEEAAERIDPALAKSFKGAKKDYQLLAAPAEGASVERAGMTPSDFDWGDALWWPPSPYIPSGLEKIPMVGPVVSAGLNVAGNAYGRGTVANLAEFLANRAANNTGGGVGGRASKLADPLARWSGLLNEKNQSKEDEGSE